MFNEYDNAYYLGNDTNKCVVLIKAKRTSIVSCNINDSCKIIYCAAFYNCSSLASITIPDSVTSIGDSAFEDCSRLTSIIVDNDNRYFASIDGNLYNKNKTVLIQYAIGKTNSSFTIPNSVTSIRESAFWHCSRITSVTIGNGVTYIGTYAFYGCSSLTSVIIGNCVTTICKSAFYGCSSLKTVLYKGTAEQWKKISIDSDNGDLTNAARYYYSETEPALSSDGTAYDGNYWHYDTDGVTPVIWKKEN